MYIEVYMVVSVEKNRSRQPSQLCGKVTLATMLVVLKVFSLVKRQDCVTRNGVFKLGSRESEPGNQIYVSGEAIEITVIGELRPQLLTDMGSGLARTRNSE